MPQARKEVRPIVNLRSSAGAGYMYVTGKNRRNTPTRISLRKYHPIARQHVEFTESR